MIGILEQNKGVNNPVSIEPDYLTGAFSLYNFEDTNNTLTDPIGNHNGTADAGVTKGQTGKVGSAWYYDNNDSVTIPDSDDFSAVDGNGNNVDWAFAAWFKRTGEVATTKVLMSKRGNSSNNTDNEWMLWHSGDWLFRYWFPDGTFLNIAHTATFDLDEWYHVGVVIDLADTAKPLKLYINGVDVNGTITGTIDAKTFNNSPSNVRFSGLNYATLPLTGFQDQTIFWKNRLVGPEIFEGLYNEGNGKEILIAA